MMTCLLLSMVYVFFKPSWLTHVTCICCKENAVLLNLHLRYFVDFILCPNEQYMFKVNHKRIRLICWMCSKWKVKTAWNPFGVFIVDFDHQYIVLIFLTLKNYLSVGRERQFRMFSKHKKICICFVMKVAKPISFSDNHCTELK